MKEKNTKSPEHTRAAWAERFAWINGAVKRTDIVEAFGVSAATASTDLAYLMAANDDALQYDHVSRAYKWAGKKPVLPEPEWIAVFKQAERSVNP